MILNPESDTLYLFAMNSVLIIVNGLSWRNSGIISAAVVDFVWQDVGGIIVVGVVGGVDVDRVVVVEVGVVEFAVGVVFGIVGVL